MILVTGATGLVGSHLIFNLLISDKQVVAIKRTSSDVSRLKKILGYYSNSSDLIFSKIKWLDADVLNFAEIDEALNGIDYVYHCAGFVSFDNKDKNRILKTNVEGTSNIVNASIKNNIKKLCFVSSIAALGESINGEITEGLNRTQNSVKSIYSESKFLSELEIWRGIEEGLDTVIVNPSVIIGPGDWKKGSSSIFYNIYKGMKFYTSGITGYVDVKDVAYIMQMLMESEIKNERFIVSSENLSYKDLFTEIALNLNLQPPKYKASKLMLSLAWRLDKLKSFFPGQKHYFTKNAASAAVEKNIYSNKKICNTLNYKFIPIAESIKKTSEFFLKDFSNSEDLK